MSASLILALLGGVFTAWVIGANSASPSFGPVNSAGAANVFRSSFIVGIAAFLGAVMQGGAVSDTVGNQLINGASFGTGHAAIILLTASVLIISSIVFRYPMPTAFTLMGSALGVGIAIGGVPNWSKIEFIVSFWLLIPFVAIGIGYGTARAIRYFFEKTEKNRRIMNAVVLVLGAYTAFTAGANQSGLVIGPLLNAVQVDVFYLLLFAGAGMTIGAWTGSPAIIESVSREYSRMGPRRAISALLAASLMAQAATLYGVPVSFNEAIISAVIGAGLAAGSSGISGEKIGKTVLAWICALAASIIIAYAAATVFTGL